MPENKILVSAVVLNYNGKKITANLLESIKKIDFPKDKLEVLLVDNNSTDGSPEFFRKNYPDLKLIENKKNLGFTGGMNSGIRQSKGKYVAILSNDLLVHKNWLKELVKVITSSEKIAIADPVIYEKPGKKYVFANRGTTTLVQSGYMLKKIDKTKKIPYYCFSPSGSCLFNKDILGIPFDPDYFIYAEDTYIGWLARLKGYEVVTVPTSILYHEGSVTTSNMNMSDHFLFLGARNRLINMLTFYDVKTLIKTLPLLAGAILFTNLSNPKKIIVRLDTYFWIIRNLRLILKKRKKLQKQRKAEDKDIIKYMSCSLFEPGSIKNKPIQKIIILLNKAAFYYCKLTGLKTIEFHGGKFETLKE